MQIKKPCQAFLRGFAEIISADWIRFFNQNELQLMISGDTIGIDLQAARASSLA